MLSELKFRSGIIMVTVFGGRFLMMERCNMELGFLMFRRRSRSSANFNEIPITKRRALNLRMSSYCGSSNLICS